MSGGRQHHPLPSLLFRRVRALALLVALILAVTGGVNLIRFGVAAAAEDAVAGDPVAAQPPPPTSETAIAALAQSTQQRTADVPGRMSIVITDLDTGVSAAYGSGPAFITASVVKVNILATLLLQKKGRLTDAQQADAKAMIQRSSNGSATMLWRQIGKGKGLDAANTVFGLTSTVAGKGGRWGTTTTTAEDQLRLLRVVFTDQSPLNAESRTYLQHLMGSVVPDQDWGVSAADTRAGAKFSVKNGWMPRSQGWSVNSVGYVEHQGHRLLMAAMSDGRRSKDAGVAVMELVAQDAAVAVTGL